MSSDNHSRAWPCRRTSGQLASPRAFPTPLLRSLRKRKKQNPEGQREVEERRRQGDWDPVPALAWTAHKRRAQHFTHDPATIKSHAIRDLLRSPPWRLAGWDSTRSPAVPSCLLPSLRALWICCSNPVSIMTHQRFPTDSKQNGSVKWPCLHAAIPFASPSWSRRPPLCLAL